MTSRPPTRFIGRAKTGNGWNSQGRSEMGDPRIMSHVERGIFDDPRQRREIAIFQETYWLRPFRLDPADLLFIRRSLHNERNKPLFYQPIQNGHKQ
jgi:hypothetical protein